MFISRFPNRGNAIAFGNLYLEKFILKMKEIGDNLTLFVKWLSYPFFVNDPRISFLQQIISDYDFPKEKMKF